MCAVCVLYVLSRLCSYLLPLKGPPSSEYSPPPSSNICEERSFHGPPNADIQSYEVCVRVCLPFALALKQTSGDYDVVSGVEHLRQHLCTGLHTNVQSFALSSSWKVTSVPSSPCPSMNLLAPSACLQRSYTTWRCTWKTLEQVALSLWKWG